LIRGKAIKGPLVQMMKYSDFEVNSYGIAKYYQDILDIFVIDNLEAGLENKIKNELGIEVFTTNTLMKTKKDRINLSKFVLKRMET
ncbi:MAG TPA: 2-phospho-L-lactate transferase, partial [Methanofastidiosum sp.]|nr:2-phospho-L-lactate transferase [Methanofastidiosum sp.]